MDHDKDDSMDDMIGEVPPSINVGHMNARFHLSKMMCTSYSGALLDNDSNTLQGVVIGNGALNGITTTTSAISSSSPSSHFIGTKPELLPFGLSNNTSASKRTLSSLYWNDDTNEDVMNGTSCEKHFNLDSNGNVSVLRTEENNNGSPGSFATLLNHLPQTPSLPQIGSVPYQIQGTNWYG